MRPLRSGAAGAIAALAALLLVPAGVFARAAPRIVGGANADISTVPYQVALYTSTLDPLDGQFCGGSIRDTLHVITAAHCVYDDATGQAVAPSSLKVLTGSSLLSPPDPGSQEVAVSRVSFDPKADLTLLDYDVAVLTLTTPLTLSANAQPIPLVSASDASTLAVDGRPAGISGWGDILAHTPTDNVPGDYPDHLQSATADIVDHAACNGDYADDGGVSPRQVCAAAPGIDSCFGDSGGPLTLLVGATVEQLGIVSGGDGCAYPGFPGIYALLSDPDLTAFATAADPAAAPQRLSASSLSSAAPRVGQLVTCEPGQWTGSPTFSYLFAVDNGQGAAPTVLETGSSTYIPASADVGKRLYCQAKAIGAGGFGLSASSEAVVQSAPVTSVPVPTFVAPVIILTPLPGRDVTPPTMTLASRTCTRSSCVVNLAVEDPPISAGIAGVRTTLTDRYTQRCRTHGRRATCAHTVTSTPLATDVGGDHFIVRTGTLRRGAIALTALATDAAGHAQQTPLRVALTLAKRR